MHAREVHFASHPEVQEVLEDDEVVCGSVLASEAIGPTTPEGLVLQAVVLVRTMPVCPYGLWQKPIIVHIGSWVPRTAREFLDVVEDDPDGTGAVDDGRPHGGPPSWLFSSC